MRELAMNRALPRIGEGPGFEGGVRRRCCCRSRRPDCRREWRPDWTRFGSLLLEREPERYSHVDARVEEGNVYVVDVFEEEEVWHCKYR